MAALTLGTVAAIAGKAAKAARAMTSGADTILSGRGIAAVHPEDARAVDLLKGLGMKVVRLREEALMDAFTAAVCLPALLLLSDGEPEDELGELERAYPELREVFRWVTEAFSAETPTREKEERRAIVERMATPGGITERMVGIFSSGHNFSEAFHEGIERAREIARSSSGDSEVGAR